MVRAHARTVLDLASRVFGWEYWWLVEPILGTLALLGIGLGFAARL